MRGGMANDGLLSTGQRLQRHRSPAADAADTRNGGRVATEEVGGFLPAPIALRRVI
jgi:hypothetical protein